MFGSVFSGIVSIDKLHDLMKEFVSLTMAVTEIGKRLQSEKILYHKHESYRQKLSLKIIS